MKNVTNEKDTVNELMALFDSTFIEGNSAEDTGAFINIDSLKISQQPEVRVEAARKNKGHERELALEDFFGMPDPSPASSNSHEKYEFLNSFSSDFNENDFDANIDSFLDFVLLNKRYPEITNPGNEHNLRRWFKDVRTGKIVVTAAQKEQFNNMRDNVRRLIAL